MQWKFRDEQRPRFGVMRGREFLMKDAYSFDLDEAGARRAYNRMFVAYLRTFARMGLKAIPMRAETGPIGGDLSHEFLERIRPSRQPFAPTSRKKMATSTNLHGNAEIHYRTYILRADEVTYNSDSGEATATGHFTLDGGPNDDHIKASHGNYNLTAETGRFYDVTATTGLRFHGNRVVLTSTAPFAFSGKIVEKTSSDHYLVYDGTITTCELPHPNWQFNAHKVVVDVGGNASIYHSIFCCTDSRSSIFLTPHIP